MSPSTPTPREQFQTFIDRGGVFVHLDPRRPGVETPASIASRPRVVLQVRRALTIPLPDIAADHDALRVTLSFGGEPFRCTVPWSAVFSLVADDGEVSVWPLSLPSEVAPSPAPVAVTAAARNRSEHPGRPLSLPPPSLGASRSKNPSRAPAKSPSRSPSRAPAEGRASARPSLVPGSLAAALQIPKAPALPRSLEVPEEAPARRRDSTPAASRAMRANDSLSHFPPRRRGDD